MDTQTPYALQFDHYMVHYEDMCALQFDDFVVYKEDGF